MALPKLFQRIFFRNNTTPALNEDNLNAISKGLSDVDDRVIELAGTIMEDVVEIKEDIDEVEGMIDDVGQYITQAKGYAQTASTKATEASNSATSAATSATAASGSASTASTKAGEASTSASTASTKAGEAATSAQTASTKAGEAATSATNAANSATAAAASASQAAAWSANPPYIGANGNWYVYDTTTNTYIDSGIDASITVTVADVTALAPDATPYVTNTGTNTDPIFHLFIPRGAAGVDGVSPIVTITTITGGHRVTIVDEDHPTGQSFDVMDGAGSGDMLASTYDPNGNVANAGGIESYVEERMGYVTPQMFGAKGDGVADDTQAFLDMFASGKNVYISEGNYYITKRLRLTNDITIDGAGADKAVIVADQNFDYSTSNDPTFFRIVSNVIIKNVGFVINYDITSPYNQSEINLLAGAENTSIVIDSCRFKAVIPTRGLAHGVNLIWGQGVRILEVRNSFLQNHCNSIQGGCVWWYNWSPTVVDGVQSFVAEKIVVDNNIIEQSTRDEAIGVWTSNDNTKPVWKDVKITNNKITHDAFVENVGAYPSDNLISVNSNTTQAAWNFGAVTISGNTLLGQYDSRCFIKTICDMGGIIIKDNHIEDNSITRDSSFVSGLRAFDIITCYNANVINNTFISTAARNGSYDVAFKSSGSINYIGNTVNCKYAYFVINTQNTFIADYTNVFGREIVNIRNNDIIAPNLSFYPTARVNDYHFEDNNIVNAQSSIAISVYKNVNWFIERNKFSAGSYTRTNNNIEGGSLHLIDNQGYSMRVYEDKVVTKWSELEFVGKNQNFEVSSTSGATPYPYLTNDILNEFATILNIHGDMLASTYDPNGDVATAGGIVDYIDDVITDALTASY